MEKSYTIPELSALWDEYVCAFATRWLIGGKWEWLKGEGAVVATRAERVKIMDHKTFIEFLKEKSGPGSVST